MTTMAPDTVNESLDSNTYRLCCVLYWLSFVCSPIDRAAKADSGQPHAPASPLPLIPALRAECDYPWTEATYNCPWAGFSYPKGNWPGSLSEAGGISLSRPPGARRFLSRDG